MSENLKILLKDKKGITEDSREVKPGFVFVAVKGRNHDGHDFIPQALENGAALTVGEKDLKIPNYIKVEDSKDALGRIASEFYGNPSQKLKVIGVTGTKGKTTTVHLLYYILTSLSKKAGIVSSIVAKIGEREIDTGFHITSPDVVSLQKFLKEMVDAGCEYAIIEVSSHGIDQERIAGVKFDVGVLTNIAPEHLDYHKTFKEYKKIKMSFINSAEHKVIAPQKTSLKILPGEFNNLNLEAAAKALEFFGIDRKDSIKAAKTFKLPQGRLEKIQNNSGVKIFVDFAHTPNSLSASLKYFKTQTKGRVIAVFGCAGERDRKKRFQMGKISAGLSDLSIFTAEDPRTEDLGKILAKMAQGARSAGGKEGKNFVRIPERGEAVAFALGSAKKGDLVAFLGKGHEKSMAYSEDGQTYEHPWSDQNKIENFLKRRKDVSAIILAAGKGTRMKSALPKILHKICGRPMISYTLENLRGAGVGEIVVVVSFKRNVVVKKIAGAVKIAIQKNPKGGTADAALAGLSKVDKNAKYVFVLYGDDTAFYTGATIGNVLDDHIRKKAILTFITLIKENPTGLGRILRNKNGEVLGIVEEKDARLEQRKIKEINDGLYVFDKIWLEKSLPKVKKSPITGEYYLVELIKMAIDQGKKVTAYRLPNASEWEGVNTPEELDRAKKKMEEKLLS